MKRWALITGAAGGIGQALVAEFRTNGYSVIGLDQSPKPNYLNCEQYLQVDLAKTVRDEDYAEEVFKQIRCLLGNSGLHALINNAAIQILGGVNTLTRQEWQTTLDVNLLAPFLWIQELFPALEQNNGSVVNISSIHANLTKKKFVAYATSKAALSGMTRAVAVDIGSKIRINAIEPAAIDTDMLKAGLEKESNNIKKLEKCHPSNRIGKANEVAQLAIFLCSNHSKFINGECIRIDGGIGAALKDLED
jgi:NAD(P)-dependent dehydrogenase (short-subunit alcohol dehydrogenase family)